MKSFTEEHFANRLAVYRERCLTDLKEFMDTGYSQLLSSAVHYYAVYRELGLSFMMPFDSWNNIYEEAK